ncbi:MAG: valine--pyruvate transaminase [Verrucomicrobiota bacterium]
MKLRLSKFGRKLSARTGILELMDDLGRALAHGEGVHMMGGGNPAHIPEMEAAWRRQISALLRQGGALEHTLGDYDEPQGAGEFIDALVECFNNRYGWGLRRENIAVTNGSQTAFFMLFNMLAGEGEDGRRRKILLPLAPEYISYADQGIAEGLFVSLQPRIELLDRHAFKYHIDFDSLRPGDDIAALCVSRPTNPTGNVLTDGEMRRLAALAAARGIPLLVDNAYGAPFPDILFTEAELSWNENVVLVFSLSKLGLPGVRTGIVIAAEEIVRAVSAMNAVVSLATGSVGPDLVAPLVRNGELLRLSRDVVRPFYERKSKQALEDLRESFGERFEYRVHKAEGAFFLWIWFKDLPVTAQELYERLKARNVLVVPGHHFFYGLADDWRHRHECIRITYTQPERTVREGLRIVAEEVRKAFS